MRVFAPHTRHRLTRAPRRLRCRLALKLLGHQTGSPGAKALARACCVCPVELRNAELAICRSLDWNLLERAGIVAPGGLTPCDVW
jgi:hypothetical protein